MMDGRVRLERELRIGSVPSAGWRRKKGDIVAFSLRFLFATSAGILHVSRDAAALGAKGRSQSVAGQGRLTPDLSWWRSDPQMATRDESA